MRALFRYALVAFALAQPDCLLLGLDDLTLATSRPCDPAHPCEDINTRSGIATDDCMRFQCVENRCVYSPLDHDGDRDPARRCGGQDCDDANPERLGDPARARVRFGATGERFDGADNNCNGVIDEGAWAGSPDEFGIGLAGAITSATRGDRIAVLGTDPANEASRMAGTNARYSEWMQSTSARTLTYLQTVNGALGTAGCPWFADNGNLVTSGACFFNESALADIGNDRWLLATIDTNECPAGRLRVGNVRAMGSEFTISSTHSNIAAGAGLRARACASASRPVLVSTRTAYMRQALAVWQGRSRAVNTVCGQGDEAPVLAMGVWERRDGTAAPAVCGTGGAVGCAANQGRPDGAAPRVLGMTTSDQRAAVTLIPETVSSVGYLVGYGRRSEVVLHFITRFNLPSASAEERADLDVTGRWVMRREVSTTVDGVALAVSDAICARGSDRVRVGLVWKEGCGADARIVFGRALVDPSARGETALTLEPGSEQTLARGQVHSPTVTHIPTGFIEPTEFVAGDAGLSSDPCRTSVGGWIVTWIEDSADRTSVRGQRVFERDDRAIPEDRVTLGESRGAVASPTVHVFRATEGRALALTWWGRGTSPMLTALGF
jgi:hypothetical protein